MLRSPFFLPWLYPTLCWRIATSRKEIYLTFDDGPVPGPTEFVLETLAAAHAKATFFCIGDNVRKHPAVFQKIISAGHAVGNHTFNHLKGWNFSVEKYMDNVRLCQTEFHRNGLPDDISNRALFRPPYGRIRRSQIRSMQDFKIIMWDVLTHDYASSVTPERCLEGTIRAMRPGSIVVFHDSLKAERNMTHVLPRLLQHFANLGYSFKTIPNS